MGAYDETISWTRAYLQWIAGEADEVSATADAPSRELRKLDVFDEAMLLMASRTQADCLHIGEALRKAERLLEDERGAWQALSALKICDRRRSRSATPDFSPPGWQEALEAVAVDMQALENRVLALQSSAHGSS